MANQFACPACGNLVDDQMKFCNSCGTPLEGVAVAAESVDPVARAVAEETIAGAIICPQCGTPAGSPDEKFCAVCGTVLQAPAAAGAPIAEPGAFIAPPEAPAPVVATSSVATPQVAPMAQPAAAPAPAYGGTASGAAGAAGVAGIAGVAGGLDMKGMQSKLDDFMGASVDTSTVGVGFNPASVTLDQANDAMLRAAFSFFGKSYTPGGEPAAVNTPEIVQRRDQARQRDEERAAARKEEKNFASRETRIVQGEMVSALRSDVGPATAMVQTERDKAAKRQAVSRLKHKVALGDMSKKEAVEQASEV